MISDAHNDILTGGMGVSEIADYIFDQTFDGLEALTMAYWTSGGKLKPKEIFDIFRNFDALYTNIKLMFAIEDLGLFAKKDLYLLESGRLAYASLTWNYDNAYAGGSNGNGGLTEDGKQVIALMDGCGIALDLAHLNDKSFFEAADACKGKIICSHTCIADANEHRRNISLEQCKVIVDRDGFIGLTLVPAFLTKRKIADSDDVIRHIDMFVQRFGADNLGFGTDFFGTSNLPIDLTNYKSLSKIVEKLTNMGYNETAVNKIMSDNYQKFFCRRESI